MDADFWLMTLKKSGIHVCRPFLNKSSGEKNALKKSKFIPLCGIN